MTCIVTDVHYRMSLAVIRDLGEQGIRVVCCERESEAEPLGFFSRHCAQAQTLPDEGYGDALYGLCQEIGKAEGQRPALLAVGAKTLALLAAETERFQAVCGLLVPTSEALSTLNDKEAVAALGRELKIPVPEEYTPETAQFPCVVKPRCGEKFGLGAAERYKIARTAEQLDSYRSYFRSITGEEPVIQQYLSGGGMGCSVLAENGQIRRSICHRRIREYPITGGPSSCCEALRDARLEGYAAALVAKTNFSGLCMVEFKLDQDGNPYLLEVNPRVWGTYPLTRAAGAGFSQEWFRLSWNRGNPDQALPEGAAPAVREGKRMIFAASDLAAAAGYLRAKQGKRAFGALGDLLRPSVSDGVWEFRDSKPAMRYYRSLLTSAGRRHG